MDQPIACSLSAADAEARQAHTARIARDALLSRYPIAQGERLTFAAGDATEQQLREVIAAEAECCAFLSFALEREGETLRVDITGPHEAQPIIAQLFA